MLAGFFLNTEAVNCLSVSDKIAGSDFEQRRQLLPHILICTYQRRWPEGRAPGMG